MMHIYRKIILAISTIALLTGIATAAGIEPSPVNVGGIFTVQLDNTKGCNAAKPMDQINLLVKGIDSGIHPIGCDPASNKLSFKLIRDPSLPDTASSKAAWEVMLGNIWKSDPNFIRTINYTVTQPGDTGTEILSSGNLNLHLATTGRAVSGGILIAVILISLLFLINKSGIVRDASNPGTTLDHRTYSLGRVQMAWWFAIILASYIFLWIVTDGIPVLSTQALGLMGISGASGLVALGVDSSKQTTFPVSSGSLLTDILTDNDGITIHRFQMVAMTVVLGLFFIVQVATHLSMPEFDTNTLAMLGISGLTYIGFKVPEQHVVTSDNNNAPGNSPDDSNPKSEYSPLPESSPN